MNIIDIIKVKTNYWKKEIRREEIIVEIQSFFEGR